MKFIKTTMACSILISSLIIAGCQKEHFTSRDISGLKPPPIDTVKPVVDTSVVIDNCDKTDGWQVAGGDPVLVTTSPKEGKGYIQGTIKTGQNFMQFIKTLPAPVNTKATLTNGLLKFWFYVQDVSLLKADGQIQFSSAADPDNKRIGWGLAGIIPTLKNGWNHLELKFTDGYLSGDGGPDLTAMNYIKVFFWTAANAATDQNFGVDDFRVATLPPPPPVEIDNCDKTDGWQVAGGDPVLVTTGQKEGKGYIQGVMKTGQNFMQFIKPLPAPVNTTETMDTGQLQFWFYVPDVSLLKLDGQIQFSSANDPDNKRIGWGMAGLIPKLKNGWNLMKLNFSDSYVSGDGGPDLTAMNYIKMFFWTNDNVTSDQGFGIDDIKVVQK